LTAPTRETVERDPGVRLSYIVGLELIQAALANFKARTGIGMNVDAPDGHAFPPVSKPANLCLLLQNFGRHGLVNPTAAVEARDGSAHIVYDAGPIGHLIVPLEVNGQLLGRLVSEPFAVAPPDFPTFYQIARALPVHPDNLIKAALEVPLVDKATVQEAGSLLRAVVDHVVAVSFINRDQLTVLQAFDSVIASKEVLSDLLLNLSIRLLHGRGGLLILQNATGERQDTGQLASGEAAPPSLLRLMREVGSWVIDSRKPITIPDLRASPWGQYVLGNGAEEGSLVAAPLIQRDRLRGAIVVLGGEPMHDPEGNLHVLSMLAAQAVNTLMMLERLAESEEQALTDSLTGLYNYRFFQQHLQRELSRASRSKTPLSLIILDIDNFKAVNDSYGHAVGNQVLQHLARLLERTTRKANVLVRYGGEEFCIVVPEGDLETARAIAERVCAEIRSTPLGETQEGVPAIRITVSAGVTTYVPDSGEADNAFSLFKKADDNLITAKKSGKDRVFAR
jgi:diguanylate cyclase (GGDEF)-like protein